MDTVTTKFIDYTPDIGSPQFWDSHDIALVRVLQVGEEGGQVMVRTKLVEQLSGRTLGPRPSFPLGQFWFGLDPAQRPTLAVNDYVVIYVPQTASTPIPSVKLGVPPDGSPLVGRLRKIARLRTGDGGIQALQQAALDPDAEVAVYSLRSLLDMPRLQTAPDFAGRLLRRRDDPAAAPQVRLLANQLALKLQSKPESSPESVAWLRTVISRSTETDWTRIRPFVRRLLTLPDQRPQNVQFLTTLAESESTPQPIRIAAYSAFEDESLFQFTAPDSQSNRIFDASVRMLQSSSPLIRHAATTLLHNLSVRTEPTVGQTYRARARSAIVNASDREPNTDVRQQMQRFADRLA